MLQQNGDEKRLNLYGIGFQPLLSHEDSNLDKQNQNLSYYLYTMGQFETSAKLGNNFNV